MPDFVPVGGSIEFRITGVHTSGKKVYNIGHVDCGSPLPTLAEVTLVAQTVAAWVPASYDVLYSNDITVNEVRARSNAEEPGPVYVDTSVNAVGNLAGEMLPLSTTLCVNLLTNTTGHSRRGRFFMFPGDETVLVDGMFSSAYAQMAELALDVLGTNLAAAGFALAIESRRHLALYQVQNFLAQRIPSHLQSRKVNRGI